MCRCFGNRLPLSTTKMFGTMTCFSLSNSYLKCLIFFYFLQVKNILYLITFCVWYHDSSLLTILSVGILDFWCCGTFKGTNFGFWARKERMEPSFLGGFLPSFFAVAWQSAESICCWRLWPLSPTYFNLSVAFWTLKDIFWWRNGRFITIFAYLSTPISL